MPYSMYNWNTKSTRLYLVKWTSRLDLTSPCQPVTVLLLVEQLLPVLVDLHPFYTFAHIIVQHLLGAVLPLSSKPFLNRDLFGSVEFVDEAAVCAVKEVRSRHHLDYRVPHGATILQLQGKLKLRLQFLEPIHIDSHTLVFTHHTQKDTKHGCSEAHRINVCSMLFEEPSIGLCTVLGSVKLT